MMFWSLLPGRSTLLTVSTFSSVNRLQCLTKIREVLDLVLVSIVASPDHRNHVRRQHRVILVRVVFQLEKRFVIDRLLVDVNFRLYWSATLGVLFDESLTEKAANVDPEDPRVSDG